MRRPFSAFWCVALCLGLLITPARSTVVVAQTATLSSCSGTENTMPMPGQYTGSWHSNADYHFAVFNTDLDLTITIDGALHVTVTPDGRLSGTATGTVDAPIHHDGIRDVSSGTGTISGLIQGILTPGSSTILLMQPVIAMQWGTFIGGGYTVPRSITMPNYQFPLNTADCVSLHGGISEQNFPTQFVTSDGTGGLTQAPGIGNASGTWDLGHTQTAAFAQLSQQVDAFISTANGVLAETSGPVSTATFTTSVLEPLRSLLGLIHQNPDIARCLLERLSAWVATTVPALRTRVAGIVAPSDPGALRHATDLARFSLLLQLDCTVPDDGTMAVVTTTENGALDRAISVRDWSKTALLARETILSGVDPLVLTQRASTDVHALLSGPLSAADRMDVARVAYAIGDDADARSAISVPTNASAFKSWRAVAKKHKKRKPSPKPTSKRKKTPTPKPTATPKPKPTATPHPTATSSPVSLAAALQSGVAGMNAHASADTIPYFSWQPVPGASTYVVFVTSSVPAALSWTWSGTTTSVQYGNTSLPGMPGSVSDAWPYTVAAGSYSWSVLALDGGGHIVGMTERASA